MGLTGKETGHFGAKVALTTAVAIIGTAVLAASAGAHDFEGFRKQRHHIKNRAKTQIGAPYRSGGMTPRGFDCSGFTKWVFKNHGAKLPHESQSQFRLARRRAGVKRIWSRYHLRIGDLVFHKTSRAYVGHAGIYIGDGKFISSTSSSGVRVDSIWDRYYWGDRWVGASRLRVTQP